MDRWINRRNEGLKSETNLPPSSCPTHKKTYKIYKTSGRTFWLAESMFLVLPNIVVFETSQEKKSNFVPTGIQTDRQTFSY